MDVFLLAFEDLAGVLDRTLMNDYMLIDKDLLVSVCSFLKPFKEVMVQLSCDTKPTIHKVLPLRQYLLQQCIINSDDQDGIQQMKKFIEKRIRDVWLLQDVHYICTLLHPSMKHFHIDPSLHDKALELVKEIMKRQPMTPFSTCTTLTDTNARDSRSAISKGILSHCFDVPRDDFESATTPYDELNDYMT
ncbi:unnamed protein product [Adineta steineri]|uniref:Uncharacterized protein n=1 Tax=Adineta steineri TaxID=433720 RepID=A0A814VAL6_9BILA|nr:unnamed protein product [Adineta steineri]